MTRVVRRLGWMALLVVVAAVGCGDDATGLDVESLAGVWIAREATVINLADETETEDLIAQGLSFRLTLGTDSSVEVSIQLGPINDVDTGTYSIAGNALTMTLDGDIVAGTITGGGDAISVDLPDGVEWDFGANGIEVPARLQLELTRSS